MTAGDNEYLMSDWGEVTFFRTDDLDALERAIADLCLSAGLLAVPYVRRTPEKRDKMAYGTGASSDQWAIALGAGRHGWSVVKAAPSQLLAEPGEMGEHRLGIIARKLSCEALHVAIEDGVAMVIAEASATGDVALSGYSLEGGLSFHGVELDEARAMPRIESEGVPRSVHEALERSFSDGFDELLEQLADERWIYVSSALTKGEEIPAARVLCFARPTLEKKPPLRVKFAVEEYPLGERAILDDGVWLDSAGITAADAAMGAAFVRKVASWLEVPVALAPGVPRSSSYFEAAPSESMRRVGVETTLLSIGARDGAELLLHAARGAGSAELEERSPHQRRRLVDLLARALVGAREHTDAAYSGFERVLMEPTIRAKGAFAGERLVTAWWRWSKSAIAIEGREVFELPGICTAIASTSRQIALALVTPRLDDRGGQGYAQHDATVIVVIDAETGQVHEVLRSDERLTFGFTDLCFSGDVLGIRAERDKVPTIVTLDDGTQHESPGDFRQWMREALRAPPMVGDLYSTYKLPMLWAGPDAVVAVDARTSGGHKDKEAALVLLDLRTNERRPLCDAAGLKPLAFSASGARCLVEASERSLFCGSRNWR